MQNFLYANKSWFTVLYWWYVYITQKLDGILGPLLKCLQVVNDMFTLHRNQKEYWDLWVVNWFFNDMFTLPADTGRGMMTKSRLFPGDLLISIPRPLLITMETVLSSEIGEQVKWYVNSFDVSFLPPMQNIFMYNVTLNFVWM